MTKIDLKSKKIPDLPGVYFFLGKKKEILYIGKATSLRNRVRSYFGADLREKRSELIELMVGEAKSVEWTQTDSVLEAIILEANLIRTHKPRYNTSAKDDKSYNHLVITNEEYPRVLVVRAKDLTERFADGELKKVFGPFPSGLLFREALKIIQRIFRFYDTEKPLRDVKSKMGKGMIDFNRQIGLYPGEHSKDEYLRTIRHICLFFDGRKRQILRELASDMKRYAKSEEFEKADEAKKKLFALTHIQDVALIKKEMRTYRDERTARIEAYDIAHVSGADMVGVMTVVEAGEADRSSYRKFNIRSVTGSNDTAALKEVLERRLEHTEWPMPQIIVTDGGTAQKNAAEHVLHKYGTLIPVISVVKNEMHVPKRLLGPRRLIEQFENDILLANAEAHRFAIAYHRGKRAKRIG